MKGQKEKEYLIRKKPRGNITISQEDCGSRDEDTPINSISIKKQGIDADLEDQETGGADARVFK